MVLKSLTEGMTPVILGGDHSVAAGSVAGVAEFYRKQNQKIGLIWIDAHADINTPESSPSGNVHGMPFAALVGLEPEPLANILGFAPKVQPENAVLIGVRDIDPAEKENIRRAGISEVYTMRDIDERGMRSVMEEALRAAGRGNGGVSRVAGYGLDRPGGRAGGGNAGARWSDVSGGASGDGDHRGPRPDVVTRGGRGESSDRRTQPHGGSGGGADFVGVREEDSVTDSATIQSRQTATVSLL